MANREQVWSIVADFSSLSKEANKAARAINKLDEARVKANSNSGRPIVHEREATQLDKLAASLKAAAEARRADNRLIKENAAAQKDATLAATRATTARKASTDSMRRHSDAAADSTRNLNLSAAAHRDSAASIRRHNREMASATRVARQTRGAYGELSGGLSILQRAFDDILPSSRSWSLVMKMLPLTAVTSAVNTLAPAVAGLGGAFVGLLGSIAPVFSALGALPTLLTAAAGSIGGIVAGMGGIGGAFKAYRDMQKAQDKAVLKSAKTNNSAEKSRQKSIRTTTRSLEKAKRDQVNNAEEIAEAQARVGEVARDNARSIMDAEKNVAKAQAEAKRAQLAINDARKEAAKSLDEYKNKLRDAYMDEEGAAQSLESARAELARAMMDPGSTDFEQRAAKLAVRQAEARVSDLRESNVELEKEAATAQKKGIEGSDQVVAARQAEADANESVVEAQMGLQRAHEDAAKATRSAQKSVEAAQQSYADGAERVQDLTEDLADLTAGTDDAAKAADSAATQVAAFEAAMAKLSPTAREVVQELIKISEAWTEIGVRSTNAMAPGLLSFLRDMSNTLLPRISDFLVRMAGGAGDFMEKLGDLLTTRTSLGSLNDMFEDSYDLMVLLGDATLNVVEYLLGLGTAARRSGLTRWMGETLKRWTRGWADSVKSMPRSLKDAPRGMEATIDKMQDAQVAAERWGRALRNTWKFLGTFFKALKPLGDWVVDSLTDATERWKEWMESPSGKDKIDEWIRLGKINLSGLTDAIAMIVKQGPKMFDNIDFEKFWDALNGPGGLIDSLGDLLGIVSEDMIVALTNMGSSIAGVLQSIGEGGAMTGVIMVVEAFGTFASIADQLIKTVPGLSHVLAGLIGVFSVKKMAVALGGLTGIKDVIDAINRAAGQGYGPGAGGMGKASLMQYLGFGNFNLDRTTETGAARYTGNQQGKQAKRAGADKGTVKAVKGMSAKQFDAWLLGGATPITKNLDELPGKVNKAAGAMSKASTFASRMGGAIKGAGGAVAGFLGPIGLATIAVGGFASGIQWLRQKADEGKLSVEEMEGVLQRVSTNKNAWDDVFAADGFLSPFKDIESMGDALAKLKDAQDKVADAKVHWLLDPDYDGKQRIARDFIASMTEEFVKLDDVASSMNLSESRAALADLTTQMTEAGISSENIGTMLPKTVANIKTALRDLGKSDDMDSVVKVLKGELPDGLVATEKGFMTTQQAAERNIEVLGDLGDESKRAADRQEELNKTQEELEGTVGDTTGRIRDQKNALDEWNQAIRDAKGHKRTLSEAKDAVESTVNAINAVLADSEADKNLEGNSDAAISNRSMFRGLADDINATAEAMLKAGVPIKDVNDYLKEQREDLTAQADGFKISKEALGIFIDELGLMPEVQATQVLVETPNLTKDEIAALESSIRNFPPEAVAEIRMEAQTAGYDEAMEMRNQLAKDLDIKVSFINGDSAIVTRGADGGVTEAYFPKSGLTQKADGGPIFGPGTDTSDSIPALLSNNEYVIRAKSAKAIGFDNLDYINRKGRLPGYATGGRVQKFATGGKATGGGGLSGFFSGMQAISNTFQSLGTGIANWGAGYSSWWGALWSALHGIAVSRTSGIVTSVSAMMGNISAQLSGPWAVIWARAQGIVTAQTAAMVRSIVTLTPAMSAAWTNFMNTMKVPIANGIKFVNSTLGTLVNKVGSFYGVKETPFPVAIPGFSDGGWTGPGTKYQPAGVVHADEYVINKSSRQRIEKTSPGLLDYMNRTGNAPGYATGGRVKPVGNAPLSGNYKGHSGIDYRVGTGTPVRAADGGTILSTPRLNRSYGWHIIQRLAGGLRAVYAHLSNILVRPGATVQRGQVIGRSGNTGNSTGPHLHFEIAPGRTGAVSNRRYTQAWLGGAAIDPNLVTAGVGDALGSFLGPEVGNQAIADIKSGVAKFTEENISPWGKIVGAAVGRLASAVSDRIGTVANTAGAPMDGPITPTGTPLGDATKVSYKGHTFSSLFASAIQAAERLAGVSFSITKGGFRPDGGLSGTSHRGDAVDIGSPITSRVVEALRKSGIAAWDRTGKRGFRPHIHGVPLPGFGFGGGSAIWQAQQYKLGGDGLTAVNSRANKMFARGGWTGPGSKYQPAGIVHADEYVINKRSRRSVEAMAPGLLDHINTKGSLPGYATGGAVKKTSSLAAKKKAFIPPRTLKNTKVYLSYLRKAEASYMGKKLPADIVKHIQMIEQLLAYEGGLLWRKDANAVWNAKDVAAWKAWQTRNKMSATGKFDEASVVALLKKNKIPYDVSTPYVSGIAQPSHIDVMQSKLSTSNKQMQQLMNYVKKFKTLGLNSLSEFLQDLGPTGIPDEFRDSTNPINGLQLAQNFSKNFAAARKYNDALKQAGKYTGKTDALTTKLEEMLELIVSGPNGPYGLQGLARELGLSIDTAAVLYRKLVSRGSLKGVASGRTSRLRKDVVDFDNLFKFAKGGIVPGSGNEDSVLAWLTPGELVIPKDVVNGMFQATAPRTTYSTFVATTGNRAETKSEGENKTIVFDTKIYNPVAEESSVSIQKRVRAQAALGLL